MTPAKSPYALIIAGATPAGCAAAIRARQLGLRTLLLDGLSRPRVRERLDWLGPPAIALLAECGLAAPALHASAFCGLHLHDWDLRRKTCVTEADLVGWVVDLGVLVDALWNAAKSLGAQTLCDAVPAEVSLKEDCVTLRLRDGRELHGLILLVAEGLDAPTAALARMPLARRAESVAGCASVAFPTETNTAGLDVVIGARRVLQTAAILRAAGRVCVSLMTRDTQSPADTQLAAFLEAARAAQLIPASRTPAPRTTLTPAGVALDLETHVGKRCLLIGEAGGFVAAFSNESIYPAMRSGSIAAETAARALAAPLLQDELSSFSAAWRSELADYLRLPNTDLSLLLPLVFNNPQMSARVARAFLLGQGF